MPAIVAPIYIGVDRRGKYERKGRNLHSVFFFFPPFLPLRAISFDIPGRRNWSGNGVGRCLRKPSNPTLCLDSKVPLFRESLSRGKLLRGVAADCDAKIRRQLTSPPPPSPQVTLSRYRYEECESLCREFEISLSGRNSLGIVRDVKKRDLLNIPRSIAAAEGLTSRRARPAAITRSQGKRREEEKEEGNETKRLKT